MTHTSFTQPRTWFLVEGLLISHWSDHSKQSIKKFMAKRKLSGICKLEALGEILTILTYGAVVEPNLNFRKKESLCRMLSLGNPDLVTLPSAVYL